MWTKKRNLVHTFHAGGDCIYPDAEAWPRIGYILTADCYENRSIHRGLAFVTLCSDPVARLRVYIYKIFFNPKQLKFDEIISTTIF